LKVKELIEKLWDFNQNAEVVTSHSETIEIGYIDDGCGKAKTPLVFIDGCDLEQDE